ncbi:hypothetical protein T4A_988 [Trichinella pseudospiralis]|uniref:Uncharacterized protein n=1 Tax=Trichinella pseudospiralis TaxID=6337 RepID=A0A0V1E5J0_TRIPS|nr:hypothetical protein T4A_988 [Trichinella pseudospiralis]
MPNWATKVALGWVATDVRLLCIATLKRLLGDPSSGGGFFERLSKKGANYDMFSVNSSLICSVYGRSSPWVGGVGFSNVLTRICVILVFQYFHMCCLKLHEKHANSQPVGGQQQQQQQKR